MKLLKLTYYIAFCLFFVLVSCHQTKHVPDGKYLLKKNKLVVKGDNLDFETMNEIIRQQPNRKTLGLKMKLWSYNRSTFFYIIKTDSLSIANKRERANLRLRRINEKRIDKIGEINKKRIEKARAKGQSDYTQKIPVLKDTISPRKFFREWFKYKVGEKPVIFDSTLQGKSVQQLQIYLKKKGYYFGNVKSENQIFKNKIVCGYFVETGKPYIIDTVIYGGKNSSVLADYRKFMKKPEFESLVGQNLDSDLIEAYKSKIARYMRDAGYYGFSPSHVNMWADSTTTDSISVFKVKLRLEFVNRIIKDRDETTEVAHQSTYIRRVYFHMADKIYYNGNFEDSAKARGILPMENNFLNTLDSMRYQEIYMTKKEKLDKHFSPDTAVLQPLRMATFKFNGELAVKPEMLELQSYLEETNLYKEYYLERTYSRLSQLSVFQTIKPVIEEIKGTNLIDVHYYLVPAAKQSYSFQPRFVNSNGFLGVAASINYNNKNLFKGTEKLTLSLSGGFESQPPIFDQTLDGEKIKNAARSFNTFEIGPTVKFDLPGLFPIKITKLSKRKMPRTILSTAYNYQKRLDFDRGVFQFNYTYKFVLNKTQLLQFGFPFASVVKFVAINKNEAFEQKLNQNNDLFLRNAYSDQFIWQDFKVTFEYNNKIEKKGKTTVFYNATFDHAGLLTSWISNKNDTATLQKQIFGVPYSQFARLDNEVIVGYPINKDKSFNFRFVAGAGIPYGNTKTSMPYDYSFFAGGANDNRGWRARSLGPGAYKYYLDTNRTATQIGDIRLGGSAEYRFSMSKLFKGAVFLDAANVWTTQNDVKRPGGQFSNNWYKEIAYSAGVGLRIDFSFFIVRLDLGLPINNPAMPAGSRWIFQSRKAYYDEGLSVLGPDYKSIMPKPFIPSLNFGIGYPF